MKSKKVGAMTVSELINGHIGFFCVEDTLVTYDGNGCILVWVDDGVARRVNTRLYENSHTHSHMIQSLVKITENINSVIDHDWVIN